ncbi:H-NS histone family protein [Bradyrhizobium sp. HKCCYLS2058]|uniref:H-NS histone family protein n=1 Tax=Bradyrhizobium TaxID=374 RepID=UPI0028EF12B8|nr:MULTISPECIES: H-NS histone family protein [unclassified Bradyrhizobium]
MSTKKIDFEAMSFDDLWSLHEQISQILAVRITSEKRELERRLAVLNRSRGAIEGAGSEGGQSYTTSGKARRKYPRVLPKYRNPQTSETWSGRGKQPRWLVAAIKTGHRIEEFAINGAAGGSKSRRQRA